MRRILLLVPVLLALSATPAGAADTVALKRAVSATGGEARDLRKLDSHLLTIAADAAADGTVAVDVYADGDLEAAAGALRRLGMKVTAISRHEPQRMVEGRLPAAALDDAAALGRTQAIVAVAGIGTDTGSVNSQGDAAHRGPQARALGPNGTGVDVGVISDTIDRVGGGVVGSQGTGDLPGPASTPPGQVQVLDRGPPSGPSDEGRAMAEIIFDGAPGIRRMFFHSGTNGPADRAQGVDELVAAGVDVIADDIFQITEPFFQDGAVAQAADRAAAAGVTYIVSAGNRGRQSWQGTYSGGGTHDFGGGDTVQTIGSFSGDRGMFISFQWDEPWGDAVTDLDIDVLDLTASTTLATAASDNLVSGLPSEFVSVVVPSNHQVGIRIRRFAGTRTPFMKYIVGGVPAFTIAEHNVPTAGAINPDASSSRGALSAAAIDAADAGLDTPEPYSSRGPAFRLFDASGVRLAAPDIRPKPDLAGTDAVATSVPGFGEFRGTSAAAPSVAAVAALVRSADPSLPVDGVSAVLRDPSGTKDCTSAPGLPDLDCGFGFVFADSAVAKALDATPPDVNAVLSPPAPTGAGGFYTGDVTASWGVGDAGSPVFRSSGCGPSSLTTDGSATFTCTATSAGGTATRQVTVNRDASPPSAPAIAGIEARSYKRGKVPSAISCTSADPTSGASCAVTGRSTALGRHTIAATATNGAGLTSASQLAYSVAAAKVTKVSRRGRSLRYTVDAAGPVTITLARKKGKKFKRVKRFNVTAKVGKNAKKLPKLRPGTYRVTVRPAGGKARTKTFKKR